jgi:hypothetical protein
LTDLYFQKSNFKTGRSYRDLRRQHCKSWDETRRLSFLRFSVAMQSNHASKDKGKGIEQGTCTQRAAESLIEVTDDRPPRTTSTPIDRVGYLQKIIETSRTNMEFHNLRLFHYSFINTKKESSYCGTSLRTTAEHSGRGLRTQWSAASNLKVHRNGRPAPRLFVHLHASCMHFMHSWRTYYPCKAWHSWVAFVGWLDSWIKW